MTGSTGGRNLKSCWCLVACVAAALASQSASASLLLNETFTYADGNLVPNGGWLVHSGTSGPVQVSSGQAVLQQGVGAEDVNHDLGGFTLGTSGVVYAAFDVSVTGGNGTVYFAHFKNTGTSFNSRVFVTSGGGDYAIGLAGSSGTVGATWATGLTFGVTYRVVISYHFDSGLSELWIDPVDINSTSISHTGATSNAVSAFALRQASPSPAGNSTQQIDNVCVATTFDEALNCLGGGDPTGGCCDAQLDCTQQTQADCLAASGTYLGDNVPCTPGGCGETVGACCDAEFDCTLATEADCLAASGTYLGDNTACEPGICEPPQFGACCNGGVCTPNVSEADCESGGGIWRGDGSGCPISCNFNNIGINEIRIDQPGNDNDEYVEIVGPVGFNLGGLTYVVIGDQPDTNSGVIETVIELSGTIPADGHYLIANPATITIVSPAEIDQAVGVNVFENSDNVTHLLVGGFTGNNGDDLDGGDDCILDSTPWNLILDQVALVEELSPAPPVTDCYYSGTTVGPEGTLVPGHVWRNPDGLPNGWAIGPFDPAFGDDTPGGVNGEGSGACCVGIACTIELRSVCEANDGSYRGTGTTCTPNPCDIACNTIVDAKAAALGTEMRVCNVRITNVIDSISSANDAAIQVQDPVSGRGLTIFGTNAIIEQMILDAGGTLVNPGLALGRRVDIEGVVGEFNGLRQHVNGSLPLRVVQLFPDAPLVPAPVVTSLTSVQEGNPVAEALESVRIRFNCVAFIESGTFAGGQNYTVTDGTNLATVRVPTNLLSVVGDPIPTGMVDIVGILSQFDSSAPQDGGYQLLLLDEGDILPATCGATPIGACCLADTSCGEVTQPVCSQRDGTFQGNNTLCANVTCPLILTGACCLPDETCVDGVLPAACCDLGGAFLGQNTNCMTGDCNTLLSLDAIHDVSVGTQVQTRQVIITDTTDLINSTGSKSFIVQDFSGPNGETRGYTVFGSNAVIDGLLAQAQLGDRIVLSGVTGAFNGLQQLVAPISLVQNCGNGPVPAPVPITVVDLQNDSPTAEDLESVVATLECVTFEAAGGTFAASTNYTVTAQGGMTAVVRVPAPGLDLIGTTIPSGPVAITGVVGQFNGSPCNPTGQPGCGYQLLMRSLSDIVSCEEPGACCVEGGGGGPCPTCAGDMDGSGAIDLDDIADFVNALVGDPLNNPAALACANVDGLGNADGLDVDDFVELVLSQGVCGGGCTVVTADECAAMNGSFRGVGVACSPDPCGVTGACCLPNGAGCFDDVTEAQCTGFNPSAVWTEGALCAVVCEVDPCSAAGTARAITPCTPPDCDASMVSPPDGWCMFIVIGNVSDPDCPSCFIFPNTIINVPCNGGPCLPAGAQQVFKRVIDGQGDCYVVTESLGFPDGGACAPAGTEFGSQWYDDVP